jgi:hypothetical protein
MSRLDVLFVIRGFQLPQEGVHIAGAPRSPGKTI